MTRKRNWVNDVTEELDLEMGTQLETEEVHDDEEYIITGDEELDLGEDDFNIGEEVDLEDLFEDEDEEEHETDEDEDSGDSEELDDIEEADFALEDLIPSSVKVGNRFPEAGVLSVINSTNGQRIAISREVHEKLGKPEGIQFAYLDGKLIIGCELGDMYTTHYPKEQGAKQIIYSKKLVEEITQQANLDFSARTSVTFPHAAYKKMNGEMIAVISMD